MQIGIYFYDTCNFAGYGWEDVKEAVKRKRTDSTERQNVVCFSINSKKYIKFLKYIRSQRLL